MSIRLIDYVNKYKSLIDFQKISIRNKLILLFSLFIITSVLFIYLLSSIIYTKVIEKQLYEFSNDTLKNKSFVMDSKLKQYDTLSMQIFSNQEFRKMLTFKDRNSYADVLNQNNFNTIINSLLSQANISDIVYTSISSPFGKYWAGVSNSELIDYEFKYYKEIKKANGRMAITNTENSKLTNNMNCFCICRLIRDEKCEEIGYLMIMVKENFFKSIMDNLNFGKDSLTYVFSQDGSIMFTNAKTQKYTGILKSNFKKYSNGKYTTINSLNGHNYLITSYKSSYTGWTLVNLVPMTYLLKGEKIYTQITIIASIIFVILSILTAISFSNNIGKPIRSLISTMREISNGNLSKRSKIVKGLEMSELSNHFNNMIDRVNVLMQLNEQKQREAARIELAMLQAQINPHFLYNTLNTIRWISIINQQDQIKNLLDSLSKLLINTFRTDEEVITMESEIDLLQNYTKIMMVRYNTFILQLDIDPEASQCLILKFILQPFVENCIIHGFRDINRMGIITIKVVRDSGNLLIVIKDNGEGIPDNEKQKILEQRQLGKKQYNSIGIYNVQRRVKLRYGEDYGISIIENVIPGTEIEIKLPIVYKEVENDKCIDC
jgi:Putative regulator of cell autolysis